MGVRLLGRLRKISMLRSVKWISLLWRLRRKSRLVSLRISETLLARPLTRRVVLTGRQSCWRIWLARIAGHLRLLAGTCMRGRLALPAVRTGKLRVCSSHCIPTIAPSRAGRRRVWLCLGWRLLVRSLRIILFRCVVSLVRRPRVRWRLHIAALTSTGAVKSRLSCLRIHRLIEVHSKHSSSGLKRQARDDRMLPISVFVAFRADAGFEIYTM